MLDSEFWQRMLEEDYKLLQLEAISPVAMTGKAGRTLNTEGESRMEQPNSGAIWTKKAGLGSWDKT